MKINGINAIYLGVLLMSLLMNRINAQEINDYPDIKSLDLKADSLKSIHEFKKAINYRKDIFNLNDTITSNLYELAALNSLIKNNDLAFYYLRKATKIDSSIICLSNPDFFFIISDKRWQKLKSEQLKKHDNFEKITDKELAGTLIDMLIRDQSYYIFIDDSKPDISERYWTIKDSLNEINIELLDSIVISKGWPKRSEVGDKASLSAFLIIQHSTLQKQEFYLKKLRRAVRQNEARKKHLALLTDRIRIQQGKKQVFGTQVGYDAEKQEYTFGIDKIRNPNKLNRRRQKYGLEPIEEYLKQWDIEF
ncbi:DUF6624 domain-containing protein [uncultured Draconibacterium sp.]|uniref:DUF6624 domain-containing protein n=1 Tax=uncultured Draconibacterium sp. TaxID=1573823 RepID=UPI0026311B7A|nr:DUF6624 domain-containing protein [uncultured Draconibacterium sp.]